MAQIRINLETWHDWLFRYKVSANKVQDFGCYMGASFYLSYPGIGAIQVHPQKKVKEKNFIWPSSKNFWFSNIYQRHYNFKGILQGKKELRTFSFQKSTSTGLKKKNGASTGTYNGESSVQKIKKSESIMEINIMKRTHKKLQ